MQVRVWELGSDAAPDRLHKLPDRRIIYRCRVPPRLPHKPTAEESFFILARILCDRVHRDQQRET